MGNRSITSWGVAGISLGGHSTWIALGQDTRISFGIPIIGCPDYLALIEERATASSVPLEPPHLPKSFVELVRRIDPASKPFDRNDDSNPFHGKKILVLSGELDKLVPWTASQSFVESLKVGMGGLKRVVVQKGIGHECTEEMLEELVMFVGNEYLRK